MKITALTENTTQLDLPVEHGLSLYIEACGHKILFDMGQTDLFAKNAEALGIDLTEVEIAALSHGHYDHGGGLKAFLEINKTAPVYLSGYAFEPYYNGTEKYIGLDKALENNPRFILTDDVTEICEGATLFSYKEISKLVDFGSAGLNKVQNGRLVPDDFRHEQYLLIEENGKRVLFSSCSHNGIINIVSRFKPDVFIGGFHFTKLTAGETLRVYAETLGRFDTMYYTCHCTGVEQYDFMKKYMSNLEYFSEGQTIEV